MPKFRKKPVVIDAEQFKLPLVRDGKLLDGITVIRVDPNSGLVLCEVTKEQDSEGNLAFGIKTLEGWHVVSDGDWIITGVKGERYPCKPDIFAATYEAIEFDGKRPTIEELEKILAQSPDNVGIEIKPDGSISAVHKSLDRVATEGGKVSTQTLKSSY